MRRLGDMLTRHRNIFLAALLGTTLILSGYANHERRQDSASAVDIPILEAAAQQLSPLEAYRYQRDQDALSDIDALEALIAQPTLDKSTREAAAAQLQEIIDNRQAQSGMEGALLNSSLSPCVVVVSGGSVTIVTEKTNVTDKDSALVLTLTAAHVGASPERVRIITAN